MAVVVQCMAVAAVLALDSEPPATVAMERRLRWGRSNSTWPVAESLGASELFPLASRQRELGLVLGQTGFVEVLAALDAELVRHVVPMLVWLAQSKCFLL
jgi:hypothetical protein